MTEARGKSVSGQSLQLTGRLNPDGSTVISQVAPLGEYPRCMTEKLMYWAGVAPDRIWMAERRKDGEWTHVTYSSAAQKVRSIGSALLGRKLSADRPLLILSENSIAHALMALAAQHVGIPSAAISPAYALASKDKSKLASIAEQLTPGMIFVEHADRFLPAIESVFPKDVALVTVSGQPLGRETVPYSTLLACTASLAMDAAHARVSHATIAKFLFTSGTTGSPKAVIQTQQMLCSNQQMVREAYTFLSDEHPVLVDWAPWNHTASGNKVFNMALFNGGSYYIDDGRPTPDMIGRTVRNLRDIAPNWYFNVPIGFQFLLDVMEKDDALAKHFFSRLRMLMYAGAGMNQNTWDRLTAIANQHTASGVPIVSGLGATETGPFALYYTDRKKRPGNIGVPARGVELKLVPQGDKLEARLKSPSVTPGYWRNETLTRDAFDEDGFYKLGDALRYEEPGNPEAGFLFDGRLAENFKLATGTWVAVGAVRAALTNALEGLASDVVIAGEDREDLRALIIPNWTVLGKISELEPTQHAEMLQSEKVIALLKQHLTAYALAATGSATRVVAALVMAKPLNFDRGEVTDKGSVNQRAVLRERADLVALLWSDNNQVIKADWKAKS